MYDETRIFATVPNGWTLFFILLFSLAGGKTEMLFLEISRKNSLFWHLNELYIVF